MLSKGTNTQMNIEVLARDLLPLTTLVPFAVVFGRALLWQLAKLSEQDIITGTAAWIAAVIIGLVLSILISLQADLLWMAQ